MGSNNLGDREGRVGRLCGLVGAARDPEGDNYGGVRVAPPRGGDEQLEVVAEPKLEEDTIDLHTDAQDGSPLVRSLSGRRIRDTKNDCVASDVSSGLWVP
jgi:hypothetical protein